MLLLHENFFIIWVFRIFPTLPTLQIYSFLGWFAVAHGLTFCALFGRLEQPGPSDYKDDNQTGMYCTLFCIRT